MKNRVSFHCFKNLFVQWLGIFKIVSILMCVVTAPAHADARSSNSISVGFLNLDWFPFHFGKPDHFKGFAVDVVSAAMKQMDLDIDFQRSPVSIGLERLRNGELDLFVGAGKDSERVKHYLFSTAPLFSDDTVLIGRADETFNFNGDVSSLIGYTVGILKGAIYGPAFDNMKGIIRVPRDVKVIQAAAFFKAIPTGEYRFAAVNSRPGTAFWLKKLNLQKQLKIYEKPIAIKKYYVAFSKKMPDVEKIAKRFDRVNRLFRSTKEYKELLGKYNLGHMQLD